MKNKILNTVSLDTQKMLVEAMQISCEMYKDFKMENDFYTNNHRMSIKWDLINDSMVSLLNSAKYPYTSYKAGFWELLLFCDKNLYYLFSIMRKDRFDYICSNPEKNAPKYFDSLVSLNNGLTAQVSQSVISGFDVYEANDKYNKLEDLCKNLPESQNEKFTHIVVVFDIKYSEISSLKLFVVNNKFEIVEEEDILQNVLSANIPNTTYKNDVVDNINPTDTIVKRGHVKLKNKGLKKAK